jgi:hypothetical protein
MIAKIVYILGIVCAIWCVIDIWKKNAGLVPKILLTILVLVLSWIGIIIYYFLLRNRV